jgi:hypothetical protein
VPAQILGEAQRAVERLAVADEGEAGARGQRRQIRHVVPQGLEPLGRFRLEDAKEGGCEVEREIAAQDQREVVASHQDGASGKEGAAVRDLCLG